LSKDTIPAYFLYCDAPKAQRHMHDWQLGYWERFTWTRCTCPQSLTATGV